jgi:hypothetical protein
MSADRISGGSLDFNNINANNLTVDAANINNLNFSSIGASSADIINTIAAGAIQNAKIASGIDATKLQGFGQSTSSIVVINASSGLSILNGELNMNNRGITNANDLELNNGSSFTSSGNLIATGYVAGDEFRGNNNTVDIHRSGTANGIRIVGSSSGAFLFGYTSGGSSSTIFSPFSDERLKENISELDYGLDEILQLRPVTYDWKDDVRPFPENTEIQYGLLAQEVEAVMPAIVDTAPDTHVIINEEGEEEEVPLGITVDGSFIQNTKSFEERPLIYALINSVKELSTQISDLTARVELLEG